jgi:hypothetical protein
MWSGLFWMSLADGPPDLIGLMARGERFIDALAT